MFKAPIVWFSVSSIIIDDDKVNLDMLLRDCQIENLHYLHEHEGLIAGKDGEFLIWDNKLNLIKSIDITTLKDNIAHFSTSGTLISAVVSDLNMPNISGIELFGLMDSRVVKILISHFFGFKDVYKQGERNGVAFFLDKSLDFGKDLKKTLLLANIEFFTLLSNIIYGRIEKKHPLNSRKIARIIRTEIISFEPDKITTSDDFYSLTMINYKKNIKKIITMSLKDQNTSIFKAVYKYITNNYNFALDIKEEELTPP